MPHIAVNGVLLNFEIRGTGRPIVLVHGLGSSLRSWDAEVAHWRGRYTVLTYDARGHGLSSRVERISLDDHVQDLKVLLECLGLEQVAMIGTSMGSCIAQAFAIRYPEHVRQLVLVAPRWRGTGSSAMRLFEHAVKVRGLDDRAAHRYVFERACSPSTPAAMRRWLADAYLRHLPAAKEFQSADSALGDCDLRSRLSAIAARTLVIFGRDDPLTPPARARELAALLPHAACLEIPNAGHFPKWEQPEAFLDAADAFLASPHAATGDSSSWVK